MKFLLVLFLLYSCSKPGSSPSKKTDKLIEESPVEFSNLSVDIFEAGTFSSEPELDFLQIQEGQSKTQVIKVKNNSSLVSAVSIGTLRDFTIQNDCPSVIDPRKYCFIKVSFLGSSQLTSLGEISESFTINDEVISIQAQSVPVPELIATSTNLEIVPSVINLGTFSRTNLKKYVLVNNKGLTSKKIQISHNLDSDFSFIHNCPTELPSRSSCSMGISFSSNNMSPLSENNKIIINGQEYPIILEKELRSSDNELVAFENEIDFGSISSGSISKIIVIKNNDFFPEPLDFIMSSLNKFSLETNCPLVLNSRRRCYVAINLTPVNDYFISESFSLEGRSIQLKANSDNEFRILNPTAKLSDDSIDPSAQAGYTKFNQVNLDFSGTIGAVQMKISHNNNCSDGSWIPYSNQHQVNLNLNSLNEYSVIFKNGPTETSCIPVTALIHDSLSEYSFLSSGWVDRTGSNLLAFSGNCENLSGNVFSYSFLDINNNPIQPSSEISCSGSYSENVIVPVGSEKIRIYAKDKAGNEYSQVQDVLIWGSVSINESTIHPDSDSGFTKNLTVGLDLSSAENAKEMLISQSDSCSGSFISINSMPTESLVQNQLNNFYVKFKNRNTLSPCLLVGSVIQDSIPPVIGSISFVDKEYGESNNSPNLSFTPTIDNNLKLLQYSISSDNIIDDIKNWTEINSNLTNHIGTGVMNNRLLYHYRLRAKDKAGNISSISSIQFKHYDLYPYIPLKNDGSGNKILDNGLSKTHYLYDFVKSASSSLVREEFSGVHSLKHQDTVISTELISYDGGTHGARNYCNNTPDIMCMVRFTGNVVLNGLHIPQVRKKGFVIYVDGDLTINSGATISMTGRGALGAGQQVFIHPFASISPSGGAGGNAYTTTVGATATSFGNNGGSGAEGAAGGGASGGAGRNSTSWTLTGGAGSAGTSWSGGSGGGNAAGRNGSCTGGNASPNGGAGGNGCATGVAFRDWAAGGGAGNGGGSGSNGGLAGAVGTGGTLIIFARGNVIHNGTIESRGLQSNEGGGASGGGSVTLIHDETLSGSGITSASGGAASVGFGGGVSGIGGAGSVRVVQTEIDDYAALSCNAIKTAYPSAVNGTYLIDNDGLMGPNPIVPVFCDMVTDGGGWTKLIGDASESSASMKTYIQTISDNSSVQSSASWTNHPLYGFKLYDLTNENYQCIDFDYIPSFTRLKFNFWGYYNNPAGGMGVMQVASGDSSGLTNPYLVYFRDAWTGSSNGHDYWLNGVQLYDKQQTDRINIPYSRTFATPQTFLRLCFLRYLGYPEIFQGVRNVYIK